MKLAGIEIVIGLAVAIVLSKEIMTLLFSMAAPDAFTFATFPIGALAVSLLAFCIRARRATRVNPLLLYGTNEPPTYPHFSYAFLCGPHLVDTACVSGWRFTPEAFQIVAGGPQTTGSLFKGFSTLKACKNFLHPSDCRHSCIRYGSFRA